METPTQSVSWVLLIPVLCLLLASVVAACGPDEQGSDAGDAALSDGDGGGDGDSQVGPGVCEGDTPHGCFVLQPGGHLMCPEETPAISAGYPPQDEWDGCNGIMVKEPFGQDPDARCTYKGPEGRIASCLCDTNLHWLCGCNAPGAPGTGTWPACEVAEAR